MRPCTAKFLPGGAFALSIAVALGSIPALRAVAQDPGAAPAQAVNRTVPGLPPNPQTRDAEAPDPWPATAIGAPREGGLVHVPVTGVYPGGVRPDPDLGDLPVDDPQAAWRGMQYFNQFNCAGCHAPNGVGGMGRSLSNNRWVYGSEPQNVYLTIVQGRPAGMPAFGEYLTDDVIWDLVAYVLNLPKPETESWGRTTSVDAFKIEQVPSEYTTTIHPWDETQPFSYGQPPYKKAKPPVYIPSPAPKER